MSNNNREPIEWIEIDLDFCNLIYGNLPCTASLSSETPAKCFNTFFTCQDKENYDKGVLTYKLVSPRSNYPKGETTFPCLRSVSVVSASANVAGSDDELFPLGKRGKVTAKFDDFPYHDRFSDKYQSERVTGSSQFDGVGYNPAKFGTFWSRLRARNPNYANRPMRYKTGYIENGVLVTVTTRHYILTEIKRDTTSNTTTVEGKDILKIADNDRAVVPLPSRGQLTIDLNDNELATFALNPEGIGEEYDEEGFAAIGGELVSFTRSGDDVTLTGRGLNRTEARSHSIDDAFQQTFSPRNRLIHEVVNDLLVLAGVSTDFIPFLEWKKEVVTWAPQVKINADIMKPEGVSDLIGELAVLGVTIWWDDVDQKIKLLVNHPVDKETVKKISDRNNIIKSSQEDRDKDRLTEVIFNTVQRDPSNGVSENNFHRAAYIIDATSKLPNAFGDKKIREIFCRWLNDGDAASPRILSLRLLNRFKVQPERYHLSLDYRDDINIAEVVELTSEEVTTPTGIPEPQLAQVIKREDAEPGHIVDVTLQRFQFDLRYAYFTENSRPVYNDSTDAQKERGGYWVDASEIFSDGGDSYRFA